jgi:hypothetical protein
MTDRQKVNKKNKIYKSQTGQLQIEYYKNGRCAAWEICCPWPWASQSARSCGQLKYVFMRE